MFCKIENQITRRSDIQINRRSDDNNEKSSSRRQKSSKSKPHQRSKKFKTQNWRRHVTAANFQNGVVRPAASKARENVLKTTVEETTTTFEPPYETSWPPFVRLDLMDLEQQGDKKEKANESPKVK